MSQKHCLSHQFPGIGLISRELIIIINYFYILTPKGLAEKTELTLNFMKRKMKEYDELKKEIE